MTLDDVALTIRPFDAQLDKNFIYSSMFKGVYYAAANKTGESKDEFTHRFFIYLNRMLKEAKVLIACLKSDPETIIGYAIINGESLEWVYVKELFRDQNIATLLLKNKGLTKYNPQNLTKMGEKILFKYPKLFKLLNKKEETTNEQNSAKND